MVKESTGNVMPEDGCVRKAVGEKIPNSEYGDAANEQDYRSKPPNRRLLNCRKIVALLYALIFFLKIHIYLNSYLFDDAGIVEKSTKNVERQRSLSKVTGRLRNGVDLPKSASE